MYLSGSNNTMHRFLALLSAATALSAAALAQCPQGATAGLVKWSSSAGYTSGFVVTDESITNPPITLATPFFMPGAVGSLNQLWVNVNGEVYLTDSTLALAQPATGALYGISDLNEMRGTTAGASARISCIGGDNDNTNITPNMWTVSVDNESSVPGQVTVSWIDMARLGNTTDRFSFQCTLVLATGQVSFNYGPTFPATAFTGRWVGISIGNGVGTTTSPSQDLSVLGTDSGTVGLIYESFTATNIWDLTGQTLTIAPNGSGGYISLGLNPYVPPICAFTESYGAGCYSYTEAHQAVYQQWLDAAASSAALPPGTSISYFPNGNGYVVVNGGGTYVPPSGTAAVLTLTDDSETSLTPSIPFPYLTGPIPTLAVGSNGHIAMAASPSGLSTSNFGTVPTFLTQTVASFRSNSDYNPADAGSGDVKWEEIVIGLDTVLAVTWDTIERYLGGVNPETFQFQLTLAGPNAGRVVTVWQSMTAVGTNDLLVGYAPGGTSLNPGSIDLATALPVVTFPDVVLNPLTLTATGRPVITGGGTGPSEVITLTATNVPEIVPGSGIGAGLLIFSLNQLAGGIDLGPAGIDIGMGGCNLYVLSLDVTFSFAGVAGSQVLFSAAIPQPLAPGLEFYAQALALIQPNSLPNGQNPFGGEMSNGVRLHFENQ